MSIHYFDTSALLKRVIQEEPHASAYVYFLLGCDPSVRWVSSDLGRIECERGIRRSVPADDVDAAIALAMADVMMVGINKRVVELAGSIGDPLVRSLDAIHLATAQLADADVMVTYDHRLAEAARALGMGVAMPGVE